MAEKTEGKVREPKKVKMVALTRVGLDQKVVKPGDSFEVAENEVERLEREGAAKRAEAKKGAE